jgi:xylan 1,4-beta-xylosidase
MGRSHKPSNRNCPARFAAATAASFPRLVELARRSHVNLEGVLTWAFEFEDQPYFAGYRQLMSNGLDLPVLNVFRMYAKMHGNRIEAASSGQVALDDVLKYGINQRPDVGVIAARAKTEVSVMIWHYFDDDVQGPEARIAVQLEHLPRAYSRGAELTHYRIDNEHSNAYTLWQKLGSPLTLPDAEFDSLKAQSGLQTLSAPEVVKVNGGQLNLTVNLPRQGISLLVLEPLNSTHAPH